MNRRESVRRMPRTPRAPRHPRLNRDSRTPECGFPHCSNPCWSANRLVLADCALNDGDLLE